MISLTNHWSRSLLISRSAPFSYFCISLRACIPCCTFLFLSFLSSLITFICFSFWPLILWALFLFTSLVFFKAIFFYLWPLWPILPLPSLKLPIPFLPSLSTEDGLYLIFPTLTKFCLLILDELKTGHNNQNSTINTIICQQNCSSGIPIVLPLVDMSFDRL